MKKMIIRTGGFALYFFSALIALSGLLLFAGTISQILSTAKGQPLSFMGIQAKPKNWPFIPFAWLVFGWLIYYLIYYLCSNKIILTDSELFISTFTKPGYPILSVRKALIPRRQTHQIKVSDIESIVLSTAKHLDKMSQKNNDKFLKENIESQKEEMIPISAGKFAYSVPAWIAVKHTPLFYLKVKNSEPHLITTKPFSKKSCRKFLIELKNRDIPVEIADVKLLKSQTS